MAALLVTALIILAHLVDAQVNWTPIFVDGNSQVDMWTTKTQGCRCGFNASRQDCACCVTDGGCQCGRDAPNRCAQCGLQDHCRSMCNITLDARLLMAKSGKSYGQIKSATVEGPAFCWYSLLPDSGQRVEIQVYRLISVGRHNGTGCQGGGLQLVDGLEPVARSGETTVCGANDRYSPPVVLFGDKGPASLLFHISEKTVRSQFLAYYSFTAANNTQGVGFQPRGGRRVTGTDCDWLYQDFSCRGPEPCRLASPGYPGVYSPNRECRVHVTTSSAHTRVKIRFQVLNLPRNQCSSHYIRVHQGSSVSDPVLEKLCGNKKQVISHNGPDLLIVFKSGPGTPPYDYNGFLATLEFSDAPPTTTPAPTVATEPPPVLAKPSDQPAMTTATRSPCNVTYYSNSSKSGHFDSKGLEWHQNCTFTFLGEPNEVVHLSLFNYKLKALSCQSVIETYDGFSTDVKPITRICSPSTRHARDPSGRFQQQQTTVSSGRALTVLLRRLPPHPLRTPHHPPSQPGAPVEPEFLDGAYHFHNERVQGTLRPDGLCATDYYGLSSPAGGSVGAPGHQHIFWNVDGPLECEQRFEPAANQSVALKVTMVALPSDPRCHTACGDGGCRCVPTNGTSLQQVDHLRVLVDRDLVVACICGYFQAQWLPVGVRSWSPATLVYSVAKYSWTGKGFTYGADFNFINDTYCGHHWTSQHTGEIKSGDLSETGQLNNFFHQSCTWLLDSNVERQLTIHMESEQNRPCSAWNLTLHEYEDEPDHHAGKTIMTFCPRQKSANLSLEWKLNVVVIKLTALSSIPPQFRVKWRSHVIRSNSRTASGPVPVISSYGRHHCSSFFLIVSTLSILLSTALSR